MNGNSVIKSPFPYCIYDDALDERFALSLQKDIINEAMTAYDRYENPFEKKWTYRNKDTMPSSCRKLFDYLQSDDFMNELSQQFGVKLYQDPTKNWWGIHKYSHGDKLDIHVDAGVHPVNGMKKELTLLIYLSQNWKECNGGHLELWNGTNVTSIDPKLLNIHEKILPKFNRMVVFKCTDNAWHGNPEPVSCNENETRMLITISYLSDVHHSNLLSKAYFIARPNDPIDHQKDILRRKRADPLLCKDIYKI